MSFHTLARGENQTKKGIWLDNLDKFKITNQMNSVHENVVTLRIIGPSKLPYPCYTGSNPSIEGSKILRVTNQNAHTFVQISSNFPQGLSPEELFVGNHCL